VNFEIKCLHSNSHHPLFQRGLTGDLSAIHHFQFLLMHSIIAAQELIHAQNAKLRFGCFPKRSFFEQIRQIGVMNF
jgi:hypothetical protein